MKTQGKEVQVITEVGLGRLPDVVATKRDMVDRINSKVSKALSLSVW